MTTAADIEAQAADWLIKQDGGRMTEALQVEFDAWLAADPRARAAFMRLETAWKNADSLRRLRPLDGRVDVDLLARSPFTPVPIDEDPVSEEAGAAAASADAPDTPKESGGPRARGWLLGFAIAATVAALGLGAVLWYITQKSEWRTYATDRGGLSRIALDDGSVINLNTNSELRVRLTPDFRRVVLARGEALFKVAHDPTRPFNVQASGMVVRAVGTEFSVRVREGLEAPDGHQDVEILVKEGRVAIDSAENEPRRPAASSATSTSMLVAGEVAIVGDSQAIEVQKVAEADVERKLSWTEGRLWFERQTLKDVVAEFNRYNRRQMVIGDPTLEHLRIGGGFEATDPDSFIAALEPTLGVHGVPDSAEVIRLVKTEKKNTQ